MAARIATCSAIFYWPLITEYSKIDILSAACCAFASRYHSDWGMLREACQAYASSRSVSVRMRNFIGPLKLSDIFPLFAPPGS